MKRTAWVDRHCGHRMHVRLGDIFDCDRDIEIPCTNSLVVGCSNEPSVLVHESNGVDWSQVLIIFLRDLACSYVILGGQADVNDVNREGDPTAEKLTCTIFLSDIPAKKIFCLSSSG